MKEFRIVVEHGGRRSIVEGAHFRGTYPDFDRAYDWAEFLVDEAGGAGAATIVVDLEDAHRAEGRREVLAALAFFGNQADHGNLVAARFLERFGRVRGKVRSLDYALDDHVVKYARTFATLGAAASQGGLGVAEDAFDEVLRLLGVDPEAS